MTPLLHLFARGKQLVLLLLAGGACTATVHAQTWTGAASSDWNTAANWSSPAAVPGSSGNVTIPAAGSITNWPVLSANTTVNNLTMNAGSSLNVAGHSITVNGVLSLGGAQPVTIQNSNAATDIVLNLNGAGNKLVGNVLFQDAVIFNLTGTHAFYDGYIEATTYAGNATFNIGSSGTFNSCWTHANTYQGALSFNRTTSGTSNLLYDGYTQIAGSFSYTNLAGGNTVINPSALPSGAAPVIGGQVYINVNGTGTFQMAHLVNNTPGGSISLQNITGLDFQNDTLYSNVSIGGLTGSGNDLMARNKIDGNFSFSDLAANGGYFASGGNYITGTAAYTFNSGATAYTGYLWGNDRIDGDATIALNGSGSFLDSHNLPNMYGGNLTLTRTATGTTQLFRQGYGSLAGNFTYNNNTGGINEINVSGISSSSGAALIGGQVNINVAGGGTLNMKHLVNATPGGSITLQNLSEVVLNADTLAANISISGISGNSNDHFNSNKITGNVAFADAATNAGNLFLGGNHISGTTSLTINSPIAVYTGYYYGQDRYDGNVSITLNSTGNFSDGYTLPNEYGGNLTVNRSAAGPTELFRQGYGKIDGSFSYTNTAGGNSFINAGGEPTLMAAPIIGGQVNISVSGTGGVAMRHLVNATPGGSISLQGINSLQLSNDTLQSAISITGLTGNAGDLLYRNKITGNFSLANAAGDAGYLAMGGNQITGNTVITLNSSAPLYTGYNVGKETHDGNYTLANPGNASISIGHNYAIDFNGDVTLNSNSGVTFQPQPITFGGSSNTTLEQLGTQPLLIPMLRMNKTGNATLTLNDPLTIGSSATFGNGNILSTAANYLRFADNATHSNASAASHVVGTVLKAGNDLFPFPVGTPTSYNPVALATAPALTTDVFSAAYHHQNPAAAGYDTASRAVALGRVSGCEYWDVKRVNGSSNVALRFTYGNPCGGTAYVNDPSQLAVAHWTGSTWENLGNGGSTGGLTGTVTTGSAVTSFSPFTLGSTNVSLNPLPLRILDFSASKLESNAVLYWRTTERAGVVHYEVERSADGKGFYKIAKISANTGAATGEYRAIDATTLAGANYYRLKARYNDGSHEYSAIVVVHFAAGSPLQISPVPAANLVSITTNGGVQQLSIRDMAGNTVLTATLTRSTESVDVSRLAAGVYLMQVTGAQGVQTAKLIKE